ncbi:MAG: O-antigen ligase family protein [Planctomycetota bacterium]|nr:O-antigen ligase family protein [Planctomycetota bacterium]
MSSAAGENRLRDIGIRCHVVLSCLLCFMLPFSKPGESILLAATSVSALIHWHDFLPSWKVLCRHWGIRLLIGWVVWSSLSLTWSTNTEQGLHDLRGHRMILVPFLIWPALSYWRALVAAIVVGSIGQVAIQFAQVVGWLGDNAHGLNTRFGGALGLFATGTWCAASATFVFAAALTRRIQPRAWNLFVAAPLFVLLVYGVLKTGGRGSLIALTCGIIATVIASLGFVRLRTIAFTIGVVGLVASAIVFSSSQVATLRTLSLGDTSRVLLARVAMDGWSQAPIQGLGRGSYPTYKREALTNNAEAFEVSDPLLVEGVLALERTHSVYTQTLADTGIVGFALLIGSVFVALKEGWTKRRTSPLFLGLFSVAIVWLAMGATDSIELNSSLFALVCILISWGAAPAEEVLNCPSPA